MIYRLFTISPQREQAREYAAYKDQELAEEKGSEWATHYREDIVMLVELEEDVCKHCNRFIHEQVGWVVHRWVHENTGAYTCWNTDLTQAEPKETL